MNTYDTRRSATAEIAQVGSHYAIQGHRFWYRSKAHMRLHISDEY